VTNLTTVKTVNKTPESSRRTKQCGLFGVVLVALLAYGCGAASSTANNASGRLTEDGKHRLYAAALAASDSPMDTTTFGDVCRKIGIFDERGKPNDRYMAFVSRHIAWGTDSETEAFRREINSKEKARAYVQQHMFAE
jgi:hypothetical protein